MAFLDSLTAKLKGLPKRENPPLADIVKQLTPLTPDSAKHPEGVDFSVLWEEPGDSSILPMVFGGISIALTFITMLILIFKH